MISLDQAWQLIIDNVEPLEPYICPLDRAVGFVTSGKVVSPIAVKPFRSSAMDGFAVKSERLHGCAVNNPIILPVVGTRFAGDRDEPLDPERGVLKIMTGAPVPDRFDAIVKFEDVHYTDTQVTFRQAVDPGHHIIPAGEDISVGDHLLEPGEVVRPYHVGILASAGISTISVVSRPSIRIASIGDELVAPGATLKQGEIYDSNTYNVAALVRPFCRTVDCTAVVGDDRGKIRQLFESNHDVIVTSGGVSTGDRDLVPDVARETGWSILFHRVAIKPGKPLLCARRGKQLLFGLPGNPLSATITCALFVLCCLKKLAGRSDFVPESLPCRLNQLPQYTGSRLLIWPVALEQSSEEVTARLNVMKSSASLTSLLNSDGLVLVPPDGRNLSVTAIPWDNLLS